MYGQEKAEQYGTGGVQQAPYGQKPGFFDISYKSNGSLRKFAGDSATYKLWNDRTKDHLARSNTHWRTMLKSLETCTNPITRMWLESQWTLGVNAWQLSEKLECFICTWVSDPIYNRRTQLAGGEHDIGNGFEIWRKLFREHHGGAEAIQLGGMRRLREWPKCSSQGGIVQHLESWVECLETYNKELLAAPNVLRPMIMSIIPSEYEDEIIV